MTDAKTLYRPAELGASHSHHVTLLDLLDRLLGAGVVIGGRITLCAADIELIDLDLAILLASHNTVTDG